jgi:hypothetical protein
MSARAYPLQWPKDWPKTEPGKRESGIRFKNVTLAGALNGLQDEVRRLGGKNLVLSSNYTLGNTSPKEAGVVAYFDYEGKQVAMPCDRWNKLEANVRAIALTIEAMRGMERWGAKHMIAAMFSGFRALPERTSQDPWEILGISDYATEKEILDAYRRKAKESHPDHGGSSEKFNAVSDAKDIALATLRAA